MKITITRFPPPPVRNGWPCIRVSASRLELDADINTRFPYGVCLSVRAGRNPRPRTDADGGVLEGPEAGGFTLDLNAPMGEPNKIIRLKRRRT